MKLFCFVVVVIVVGSKQFFGIVVDCWWSWWLKICDLLILIFLLLIFGLTFLLLQILRFDVGDILKNLFYGLLQEFFGRLLRTRLTFVVLSVPKWRWVYSDRQHQQGCVNRGSRPRGPTHRAKRLLKQKKKKNSNLVLISIN